MKRGEKTMLNNVSSPEERRLVILRGIDQDLTNLEIAEKMDIRIGVVKRDLKAMKYVRDPELIQAYTDKKKRALKIRQKPANERNERFKQNLGAQRDHRWVYA
jgi:hypothetical protein